MAAFNNTKTEAKTFMFGQECIPTWVHAVQWHQEKLFKMCELEQYAPTQSQHWAVVI